MQHAAQLPNQAALANATEDESDRDDSGIESESSSDSESMILRMKCKKLSKF